MKNWKYITPIICMLFVFTSCVDDESIADDIAATPNVIGFVANSGGISGLADGSEYSQDFPVAIVGPQMKSLSGEYTASIEVDPSSTAVEGTHYRLDQKQFSVSADKGFAGTFTVTMLSDGIVAPLEKAPVLVLNVTNAQGTGNIVGSGRKFEIKLLYACTSELAGTWLSLDHPWEPNCDGNSVPVEVSVTPVAGSYGKYLVSDITDLYFGGNPCSPADICGFINDVCGDILVSSGGSEGCDYGADVFGSGTLSADGTTMNLKVTNAYTGEQTIVLQRK